MRRTPKLFVLSTTVVVLAAVGVWYLIGAYRHARRIGNSDTYRSAQPSPADLKRLSEQASLKTVINLRGRNEDAEWFRRERDAAKENGLRLVDLPFESFDSPPRIETLALLDELDNAARPILLHCESGIDRSGWAAGVVRLLAGDSIDTAVEELQHWCDPDTCALHEFFDSYRAHLRESAANPGADTFRQWILDDYYPEPYRARIRAVSPPSETVRRGESMTIEVEIVNDSSSPWLAGQDLSRGIRAGARILGPFDSVPDDVVARFRSRENLYRDVFRDHNEGIWAPGDARIISIAFAMPDKPGLWVTQIDMVDEGAHWFCDLGGPGLIVAMRVE